MPREQSLELCYRVCSIRSREEFRLLLRNGTARGGRVSLPREEWLLLSREGLVGDLRCSTASSCLPSRKGEAMPSRPSWGEEKDWDWLDSLSWIAAKKLLINSTERRMGNIEYSIMAPFKHLSEGCSIISLRNLFPYLCAPMICGWW